MERYSRNRIYVSPEQQRKIRETRIVMGGAGIGSIVAECALRLGFEKITIVDGDKVEVSNLNRQNYTKADVGKYKAECLCKRLKCINSGAAIQFFNSFIDKGNAADFVEGHDIAINALDYKDDTPFVFDEICSSEGIPVLHPYNFGWSGFLTIIKPGGYKLTELSHQYEGFELKVAEYVSRHCAFWNIINEPLTNVVQQYRYEKGILPQPQLSVGSWIAASLCVNAMFKIATGQSVRYFPKFYLSSMETNETNSE